MPFWVAGALIGSSLIGASASKSAADTQASAQTQAANTQQGMFNTINAQEQPFMQAGYGATTKLNDLLGTSGNTGSDGYGSLTQPFNPSMDQLENYPGYQFALKTGGQAVRNASTPGSGALSGAALKDLMGFNTGMASQNYQNYFNNTQTQQQNIFSRLSNIANLGQNAASNTGQTGAQLGTGIAQAQAAAGKTQGQGTLNAAGAITGNAIPLAYLMGQQNTGSSVSQSALNAANNSSDPIASLNSTYGWTGS